MKILLSRGTVIAPSGLTFKVTPEAQGYLCMITDLDWDSLMDQFRLNLQSRIVSQSTTDDLLKLQGKIEGINEIAAIFKDIRHPAAKRQGA